ncbi:MAG: Hsp33 family molecular chaperone HslO [Pseudomonadota bacterium]|nr:Hsp33 family molecular chaperone HslO [Pseudomonadota bacterium]
MHTDYAQRFIFQNSAIRGEIVRLERSLHTISQQREYPSSVLKFLGETLVANVLLTTTLKFEGQITMQMQHDGPLQMLVAKCNHHLQIRGVAQWDETCSDQQLQNSFKHGKLVITLQQNDRVDFYQSVVAINNQPIAQVMEHYFVQSEQLPTRLWLASNANVTVGLLVQQIGQEESDREASESCWEEVIMLTSTITENELLNLDNETLLHRLYHEHEVRLFNPKPVTFHCGCNITKMQGAILVMGREEALKLLNEFKNVSVKCEYCNNEYTFTEAEVLDILANH